MAYPMIMDDFVFIEEQGLRDGLQTVSTWIPTETKLRWVDGLLYAGVSTIQLSSFVHPKWVPQMADAEALFTACHHKKGQFSGLVLNNKGVDRALSCGASHLSISYSASDTHSRKNTGMSKEEARISIQSSIIKASQHGMKVRAGVQCAFGCRYEGKVDPATVIGDIEFFLALPVDSLALADSTGMGNPKAIHMMSREVMRISGKKTLSLHLHNTENKGYANVYAGLEAGVRHFDTAFGGLGGCPFIKNASGNIATEDTVNMLHQMGMKTGIDVDKLVKVSLEVEKHIGVTLPGLFARIAVNREIQKL
ncbi:MAG TPA: hydroxymethylglutaryl-CoA lyase [Saprospiraceae bacterium]|nr:hydroxymethylglutaryl-CoA lyase [Saprospiraceae bacterium]